MLVLALAACRDDKRADQLQRQVDDLTLELARLRLELEARNKPDAAPVPAEAPVPEPPVLEAPDPSTLTPKCREYLGMVTFFIACERIPQAARDAITKSADVFMEAWAGLTPDARRDVEKVCPTMTSTLRKSAREMGCVFAEREP